jgi:uncharacterized protein with PIN domain
MEANSMPQIESDMLKKETFPSEGRACPHCEGLLKFRDRVWNVYTKQSVRVLECTSCQKLIWDD